MTPPRRDPELDFHLEMLTQRYVDEGLDPDAARAKALSRMGDLGRSAARRHAIEDRKDRRVRRRDWMHGWGQDVRTGWRVLRRSPGFVAIAIVMLGLGTGASAAIFSVVDAVILRSPFADVDQVAMVLARRPDGQLGGLSLDRFERLAATPLSTIVGIGIDTIASPIVSKVDLPKRTQTVCLSASMPAVIGAQPRLGRWFTAVEARRGAPAVAVVSHTFWQRTLGANPAAIGRVVALDGAPVTVIGVMPPGFDGPYPRLYREVWVPFWPTEGAPQPYGCSVSGMFVPLARLRPGAQLEVATQELNAMSGAADLVLSPYADELIGDLRSPMHALLGAVLAVLLIAFANVTNLGLERLAGRRREVAVRLALGATRTRLVRETVAEHLLLSIAGGLAGIGVAAVSFGGLMGLLPASLPNLDAIDLNWRVLFASLALTIVGGIGAGLVAAWHAATSAFGSNLAAGDRGFTTGRSWTRQALVSAELALGVLLLVGALLMVRTFLTLRPSEPGFDATGKHIALIRLEPGTTPQERRVFAEGMILELSRRPGIRAVAATTSVPMRRSVAILPAMAGSVSANTYTGSVTANYFDLMKMSVRRGRGFTATDRDGAPPVAVVNETFVRRWLPDTEPLGATIALGRGSNLVDVRIVGVLADTRSFGHDTRTRPFVYRPLAQDPAGNAFFMIDADVRTAGDIGAAVRTAAAIVKPGVLVDEVERLADEMNAEVARPRLGAWLFGLFAALAVLLAAAGLAAILTWSVTQRRREIGVRIALGATVNQVRALVVGQTLRMVVAGVAVGLLSAAWATRLLEGWLYGVDALDVPTFAVCGTMMVAIGLLAAWLPAHRAARVDPVHALRGDA
jgi:predicted permease